MTLTEKEIIKQLKCLVAKQQAEINSLQKQLSLIIMKDYNQNLTDDNFHQQHNRSFYDNLEHSQHFMKEKIIHQLQKQVKDFYLFQDQELHQKYLNDSSISLKGHHQFTKFNSLQKFAQFFPTFISDIKSSLISMKNQIQKLNQQQISLSKKIISQQHTLNQIINEYENNIKKSEIIQQKLLKKIQTIQSNQVPAKIHHQYLYQSSQNKQQKINYYP